MNSLVYQSLRWPVLGLIILSTRLAHAQETLYDSGYQEGILFLSDGTPRPGLFSVQLIRNEDRDNDGNTSVTETYTLRQRLAGGTQNGNGEPVYIDRPIKQETVDRLVFRNGYELRRVGSTLARIILRTAQLTLLEDHPGFNQRFYPGPIANDLIVSDGLTITYLRKPRHYKAWLQKQASQQSTGTALTTEPTALDVVRAALNTRPGQPRDTLLLRDGQRLPGHVLDLTTERVQYRALDQSIVNLPFSSVSELHFQQGGVLCLPNPNALEELAVPVAKPVDLSKVPEREIVRLDNTPGIQVFAGYAINPAVGLAPFRIQGLGNFGFQKQFYWPLSNRLLPVAGLQLISFPYRQDPAHVSDILSKGAYLGFTWRITKRALALSPQARRYGWLSPRLGAYHTIQTYQNDAFLPTEDGGLPGVSRWLLCPGLSVGYRRGLFLAGLAYNYFPSRPVRGLLYQSTYYDELFFKEPQHHLALQLGLTF